MIFAAHQIVESYLLIYHEISNIIAKVFLKMKVSKANLEGISNVIPCTYIYIRKVLIVNQILWY